LEFLSERRRAKTARRAPAAAIRKDYLLESAAGAVRQGPHAREEMRPKNPAVNRGAAPPVASIVTMCLTANPKKLFA
jgi:hypothetical protein